MLKSSTFPDSVNHEKLVANPLAVAFITFILLFLTVIKDFKSFLPFPFLSFPFILLYVELVTFNPLLSQLQYGF